MKKTMLAGFALTLALGSSAAFGAFSIEQLHDATKKATDDFTTANPDHVEHFVGYKTWKSGEDAKVKIYVSHDGMNMEFNYVCHIHDSGVECHGQ